MPSSFVGCANIATLAHCDAVRRGHPLHQSDPNYVIADRSGALCDLELKPNRLAVLADKRGIIVHANHFCSSDLASEEALLQNMPDSALRQFQMEALLLEQHGRIGFDHLKSALADHKGWPTSICRHQSDVVTIASLIA